MLTFLFFLLSAQEFLSFFGGAHIFIVSTIILAFLCVKPVRPCGRSSDERRRSLIYLCDEKNLCPSAWFGDFSFLFFFAFLNPPIIKNPPPGAQVCSGRVWLNGRRSSSLSSSRRAHLEKAELCPRGEDEGMMSCVRPSLPLQPAAPARLSPSRHPSRNSSCGARSPFFVQKQTNKQKQKVKKKKKR